MTAGPGWIDAIITLSTTRGPRKVKAWRYGELAVHRLQGPDGDADGWTISHAALGFRIASLGRVFKDAGGAMRIVDAMYPAFDNWADFFRAPKDDHRVKMVARAHDEAEFDGLMIENFYEMPVELPPARPGIGPETGHTGAGSGPEPGQK